MSAISVGVSRVAHDVNPYIPELLQTNQSSFVTDSLSHSQDSHSPHSSTSLNRSQFGSLGCLDSYRVGAKESPTYPTCTYCRRPIAESYLYRIRGQTWHEACATCSVCSGELTDVCFLHDGRLFCPRDYDRLHAIKCTNCRQPMRSHELFMRAKYPKSHGTAIATDATRSSSPPPLVFHVSCFTCCVCQQPLAVGDPYTIDPHTNRPICRTDYLSSREASESSVNQSVCSPRTGRCAPQRRTGHQDPRTDDDQPGALANAPSPAAEHWTGPAGRTRDTNWTEQYDPAVVSAGGKRIRTSLTDEQRLHLQKAFELSSRPSKQTRERLAHELGVPVRVVQVWFQNQRARDKRAAHSNRSCNPPRTNWSKSQPVPDSQPSPAALTPSPRTSVESGSYLEFGGFSVDGSRRIGPEHLSSPKHLSDSQPWRPAWLVGTTETDPAT